MLTEMPKIKNLLPRGIHIHSSRIFLHGSPRSGKTSFAFFYASRFQHICYINLAMLVSLQSQKEVKQKLLSLPKTTQLLILDNFYHDFLQDFSLDSIKQIPCIFIGDISECPQDFTLIRILALSFEEYLSFDTRNLSIETLFANFIKDGNNPEIYFLADFKKHERKWEIMKTALQHEFHTFYYMLALQSLPLSTYTIYKYLKKYIKISKDKLYILIDSLAQRNIIHLCKHIDEKSGESTKKYKLYFYDFSLSEFSDSKRFVRMYENMIFLELIAMGFELVYSDFADFIDTRKQIIFLCMPFVNLDGIQEKVSNIRSNKPFFTNFQYIIISMNLHYRIDLKAIIIDFSNLSLVREQ